MIKDTKLKVEVTFYQAKTGLVHMQFGKADTPIDWVTVLTYYNNGLKEIITDVDAFNKAYNK